MRHLGVLLPQQDYRSVCRRLPSIEMHQSERRCSSQCLGAGFCSKLAKYRGHMVLNCLSADPEALGDFCVGLSGGQVLEYLQLARSQM